MASVLRSCYNFYVKFLWNFQDQRVDSFPLISSPIPLIATIAFYFYFVYGYGPKLMKNRKPLKLNSIIVAYNIVQVVANALNASICLKYMLGQHLNWSCLLAPWGDSSEAANIVTRCSYVYFLLKTLDLLDTIFFVLRKKTTQITFLHTYHHAGMLTLSYFHVKFMSGGGHSVFLGLVNSYVHLVMYSYYFATAMKFKVGSSWKKFITQVQMIQFLALIIHNVIPLFTDCSYMKFAHFFLIAQNFFMLVLFVDFYYKAYVKKTSK